MQVKAELSTDNYALGDQGTMYPTEVIKRKAQGILGPSKQDRLHRFHKACDTQARFGRISKTLLAGGGKGQPGQIEWCVQRGRAA